MSATLYLSQGGAIWWTLTKERQTWCNLQVKLCDPCLSALWVCPRAKIALCKNCSLSFSFLSQFFYSLIAKSVTFCCWSCLPDINEILLQLIYVVHTKLIHSMLHDSPDLVIVRVQVWAVRQPEVGTSDAGHLPLQQLNGVIGAMCQCIVLFNQWF